MSEIRSVGKHTLVYGLGTVISKLASFVMLPIYTTHLTPTDYGTLELLTMTIEVIATLAGVGLASSVFRFYAESGTPAEKGLVLSTASMSMIGIAGATAAMGMFAAPALSDLVLGEAGEALYFRMFFLIYFLSAAEVVPLLFLRTEQRSVLFVSLSVMKLVSMLSLNVYFVVYRGDGVVGVLLSNVITSSVATLGLLAYLYGRVGVRFSAAKAGAMVRFGAPVAVWTLANFVMVFSDRYFVNHWIGTGAVGIYSLAYKFAFVLSAFAFTPFQMIWDARRYEVAKREDAQEIYGRVFTYMNLALGLGALGIVLFVGDTLATMADPAFLPAVQLVPLVVMAQIFYHWVSFCNIGLFLQNRTGMLGRLSIVSVLGVIVLNFLLIPRFGIHGAAWATLLAYAGRFVLVYAFSQRAYHVRYPWGTIAKMYLVFGVLGAVRMAVAVPSIPSSVAFSSALGFAAAAIAYVQVLSPSDRIAIRRAVARLRPTPALQVPPA